MKNPLNWLLYRRHTVSFAGKEIEFGLRRFQRPKLKPQEYAESNFVVCGCCGEIIVPGNPIWLFGPVTDEQAAGPGVLAITEEGRPLARELLALGLRALRRIHVRLLTRGAES